MKQKKDVRIVQTKLIKASECISEVFVRYKKLSEENAQLKTEYEKECHRADELEDSYWKAEKENQKLKEEVSRESYKVSEAYCFVEELKDLLKECVPYVNRRFMETRETLTKPYTASDKVLHKKAEKLLAKIDEVLK